MLFYFRKQLVKPIISLSEVAEKLARGENTEIPISHTKEIRSLAKQLKRVDELIISEKLAKEGLFKAMSLVEKSQKAKDEYIQKARKAMKEPIRAIILNLELLAGSYSSKSKINLSKQQQIDYIKKAHKSAFNLYFLTTDELNLSEFNVNLLIKEVVEVKSKESYYNEVRISDISAFDIPLFYGDELRIKQVLLTMLHRAIRFAYKNSTISIVGYVEKQNLVITVKSKGLGLNNKEISKIINKEAMDFILDETELDYESVDKIIALHKGKIEYKDVYNEGSEVIITLPYTKEKTSKLKSKNVVKLKGRAIL
jgi:light-regulated signal transduction histidine kinase (bacteriophytochrome)